MSKVLKLYNKIEQIYLDEIKKIYKNEIKRYSNELYKQMLALSREIIKIMDEKHGINTSIPRLMRSLIEEIIDLINLAKYGKEYLIRLKLMHYSKLYSFYRYHNYNDKNEKTIVMKLKKIQEEEDKLVQYCKDKELNNDIVKAKKFSEIRQCLTVSKKIELLTKIEKNDFLEKYKEYYYIMSFYTHTSIIFIDDFKNKLDKTSYKELITTILMEGLENLALITQTDITEHEQYKNLKNIEKKIKKKIKEKNEWDKIISKFIQD